MELRYRGTTYQSQEVQIETVTSGETAPFLGQTYLRRRP